MNKTRKTKLSACIEQLQEISNVIDFVKTEEEDVRDNTPESFHETDRYEVCESACDAMDEAIDLIQDVIDKLEEIDGVTA